MVVPSAEMSVFMTHRRTGSRRIDTAACSDTSAQPNDKAAASRLARGGLEVVAAQLVTAPVRKAATAAGTES